jgi:hypothetical protein
MVIDSSRSEDSLPSNVTKDPLDTDWSGPALATGGRLAVTTGFNSKTPTLNICIPSQELPQDIVAHCNPRYCAYIFFRGCIRTHTQNRISGKLYISRTTCINLFFNNHRR